jgi:hypothetical protein
MKPIKMFGLAALVALMAMAFVSISSAMAETTALCSADPGTGSFEKCAGGNLITHVHETQGLFELVKVLNNVINVECNVLFLGDTVFESLSSPLVIQGSFTYSSCNSSCTITEVGGPHFRTILKLGHETADVTDESEMQVKCSLFLNCTYNGEGLKALAKGSLLSFEPRGEVRIERQELHKVGGGLCPSTAKLDIVTTPLSATYIAG